MRTEPNGTLKRLQKNETGTVAIVFSLSAFVLIMMAGLAVDIGRAVHASTKISAATDAAALASAKALRDDNFSDARVQALAQRFFDVNFRDSGIAYASINSVKVIVDRSKGQVEIDVDATVPTLFAAVAGIETIAVPKSSIAVFDSKDIEVGLQLDVTGSMQGQKLQDLKTATKELIDVLLPDQPASQKVRIGLAPFSAGVNAGSFARAVNGNRASNGCTYERLDPIDELTDALPAGPDALKTTADLPANAQSCPGATVLPMTDDKSLLKRTVEGYEAQGSTAGHLGTSWAWYLLSPRWSAIWPSAGAPAPYRDGKTAKIAVLMTDGIYNTIGGINFGDTSLQAVQSSRKARALCERMKAEGIVVYTVGFKLGSDALPVETLRDCASSDINFFRAENGDELRSAFRDIAEQITTLRLTR